MSIELTESTSLTTKTKSKESEIQKAVKKIIPVAQIDDKLKMVVYSRNKVGKTRFACSSNLKTLLIDCNEKGFASVRKRTNVIVYPMGRWEDFDPIYWYLKGGQHDIEVVVIDTITMLATLGMKWVLKDDVERDFNRDPMTPDKRSWGKLGEMMKDAIIRVRNLDMHVIFTAQEKTTNSEDEDGGAVQETHPELSPSPRSVLLSSVGVIGRLYTRETETPEGKKKMERRMLLGSHPKFVAGNRYDELKYVERNPTLQGFLERIGAEGKGNASTS